MIDLAVLVDNFVHPAGRVDRDVVVAAMEAELSRLIDQGGMRLSAEGPVELGRLRIDGGLVPLDRMVDATALGTALAQVLARALEGGP